MKIELKITEEEAVALANKIREDDDLACLVPIADFIKAHPIECQRTIMQNKIAEILACKHEFDRPYDACSCGKCGVQQGFCRTTHMEFKKMYKNYGFCLGGEFNFSWYSDND